MRNRTSSRGRIVRGITATAMLVTAHAAAGQAIDTASAAGALRDYRDACHRDAGALWGRSLCGPIALVDARSRLVLASDSLPDRAYVPIAGGLFVGTLPSEQPIANTAFDWGGQRWAMVLLPIRGDRFSRTALLVHESFHREQAALGLLGRDPVQAHLDHLEGRRWFRLEIRALATALDHLPSDAESAREAARDALLFRARRHQLYPGSDTLEAALEMQEGLAEYTGERLAATQTGVGADRVARNVRDFQSTPTYVRSFAYATGPAIGFLLDQFGGDWRTRVRGTHDLGRLLDDALGWRAPSSGRLGREATARAIRYGDREIVREETTRDSTQRARLADYRARLLDGPTIRLRQRELSRSFNPQQLVAFDSSHTVFPTGTFSAQWGKLEVGAGGALVDNDMTMLRLEAPRGPLPTQDTIRGPGWTLTLAPSWILRPVPGAAGSYEVTRTP